MILVHKSTLRGAPEAVWALLADVEGWPRWAPAIRAVRGLDGPEIAPGHRFALRQPMQPETVWRVIMMAPGRSFAWQTERATGFASGHVVAPAPGGCRVTAWLRPTGTIRIAWPLLRPLLHRTLEQEARGLAGAVRIEPSSLRVR